MYQGRKGQMIQRKHVYGLMRYFCKENSFFCCSLEEKLLHQSPLESCRGKKLICDGNLLAKATEFVPCA